MASEKCRNCAVIRGDCQTTTAGPLCLRCRRVAHRIEERIFVGNVVFTRVLRFEPANKLEAAAIAAGGIDGD